MPDLFVAEHVRNELQKRKVEFNRTWKEISRERRTLAILMDGNKNSDVCAARLHALLCERDNLSAEIHEKKRILNSA